MFHAQLRVFPLMASQAPRTSRCPFHVTCVAGSASSFPLRAVAHLAHLRCSGYLPASARWKKDKIPGCWCRGDGCIAETVVGGRSDSEWVSERETESERVTAGGNEWVVVVVIRVSFSLLLDWAGSILRVEEVSLVSQLDLRLNWGSQFSQPAWLETELRKSV